ncbi:hypothetical protein [Chryseobacterium luquanense]|uniref:Uncharacterized protein n=1 Tax=Chryseobacterium luquanense TaxID=2983766 RepID=A0ABT3Y7T3_9FLAO|nr:hypothetical protein [Chryseobacterium luquanense]MCX8534121.1 hypothetical protein [Chryseobacterium luquanense]
MKIKYILILLGLVNLTSISCQSKTEKIDLNIIQESYENIIKGHKVYNLRYNDYVDTLHNRIVLQGVQIQEKWQPFNIEKLDYMDVYFNKENEIVGFKGYFENNSSNNTEDLYKNLSKEISNDANFWQIKLKNNDPYILVNEWESKEMILGLEYEKGSKRFALTGINKIELPNFFDEIFYSEFLNLTKFRDENSQIILKELQISPSSNDKSFYKEKFNELKKEYNQK